MNKEYIESQCKIMRKTIFKEAFHAGGGHMGACFSITDVLGTLYFGKILNYDSKNPKWEERDKLILSKGHAAFALYAVLGMCGYFDEKLLENVCQPNSFLGGHPKIGEIPGVEASTGALGHGLAFGIGIALSNKLDKKECHTYVILGDGECQEGSIWEGALSAPNYGLDNLTVIIDHNKLQAMDNMDNILKMEPFMQKWIDFGWDVQKIDGHNINAIYEVLTKERMGLPRLIIANTVKGKGVSFMEGIPIWHFRMPDEAELVILMEELEISREELMPK